MCGFFYFVKRLHDKKNTRLIVEINNYKPHAKLPHCATAASQEGDRVRRRPSKVAYTERRRNDRE